MGPGAPEGTRRGRGAATRFARFVLRTLRGEWNAMVADPVRRLARRGLSGLLLAFVAAFGVIFFHAIAQHPRGETVVRLAGGVQADLPLWQALLRTPVSLYVPALDLPVWAGITQLFLAFALAELTLGRGRTLFISYATTLAGTLTVRVMLAVGPGWWGFGLPPEIGHVLDTGPSAAVVGLFTYLSVVRRAPVVFFLTGGSMVVESVLKPNLAGREHLIAVATALVLALIDERAWRVLRRRRPTMRTERRAIGTGAVGTEAVGAGAAVREAVGAGAVGERPGQPAGPAAGTEPAGLPPTTDPAQPDPAPTPALRPEPATTTATATALVLRSDRPVAGPGRPDRGTSGIGRPSRTTTTAADADAGAEREDRSPVGAAGSDEAVLATETAPSRTAEPQPSDIGRCLDGHPSDTAPAAEPRLLPRRSPLSR